MQPVDVGSPIANVVLVLSSFVLQPLQFLVPCYLIARRQPRRDGFTRRCAMAGFLFMFAVFVISILAWAGYLGLVSDWLRYVLNFITYSTLLVLLVPAVLHCFDTGFWNALFCATAAYTIQNLGSGAGELARLLISQVFGVGDSLLLSNVLSNVAIFAVVALYYRIYIRRVDSMGRLDEDAGDMLIVLVLVILVVIAYDVIIRGLGNHGVVFGFLIALRVVHLSVCVFVLYAEYEMLFNARLTAEIATREALSAERERQYELSRETISAVNARMHDIRHRVARELTGEDAQVSREVLKNVIQDISVFDTQVKTGNDALDTILTEKSLTCTRRGVTLSCIADGTALRHMTAADLYGLFSLLLDRAMEEVCDLDDKNLRSVSLTLRRVGELALLHVEHYAKDGGVYPAGELEEIVSRYGGTLNVSDRGKSRAIDAMLPIPSKRGTPLVHIE